MKQRSDAAVTCSLCGRTVPGWVCRAGGYYVRPHNALEGGRRCWGSERTDHEAVTA